MVKDKFYTIMAKYIKVIGKMINFKGKDISKLHKVNIKEDSKMGNFMGLEYVPGLTENNIKVIIIWAKNKEMVSILFQMGESMMDNGKMVNSMVQVKLLILMGNNRLGNGQMAKKYNEEIKRNNR